METAEFTLRPIPPFRLDLTSWAIRRRQSNSIDQYDGARYCRAVISGDGVIGASVLQAGPTDNPSLRVQLTGNSICSDQVRSVRRDLERLLGLRIDLTDFYRFARRTPRVRELVERFMGLKPPRFPSVFETLLNAISCQQVSLTVGLLLLNRLVWSYGRTPAMAKVAGRSVTYLHAFPTPDDLAHLRSDSLRKLGFSTKKSEYIIGLSRSIVENEVNLDSLQRMDDDKALGYLQSIPGVGRWSSQYVLLRGLGRLHCFPADDVGAQNGLKRMFHLKERPDYERTIQLIEPWQPYAGEVYFHMLLDRLDREGAFSSSSSSSLAEKEFSEG